MVELVRRTVGPAIEVVTRLHDGVWNVKCDPNQLENALLNLCINARDAMPDGGTLTIWTADRIFAADDLSGQDDIRPGKYVEMCVSDTGVGMAPTVLAKAFEPFFTTKPLGQGTGLGLSQLYGFVQQSGGFVRLESKLGAGTTVRLYFPWHQDVTGACEKATEGPGEDTDVKGEIVEATGFRYS
jgi:signal transduction histidine kinase